MIFQQPVNSVEISPQRSTGDDQPFAGGLDDIALVAQRRQIEFQIELLQMGVVAQDDFLRSERLAVRDDRQFGPANPIQKQLQFFGGMFRGR